MKSTAEVTQINPNAMVGVKLMSEEAAAIRMSNTDIVERFSTNDKYNAAEQKIIGQAINILASKIVSQENTIELTSAAATRQFLQLKLATSDREIFAVIFMDSQHRIIKYDEMYVGTIDAASVYTRDIMRRALDLNAAAMILAHNHPSGILEASQADDLITRRIFDTARLFDILVLDHIIVSPAGTMSYAELGKMPF